METRYVLYIDGQDYDVEQDDLSNWDEILCSYKRDGMDGVVRSFTSKFVFVNTARRLLLALYLAKGFQSKASITVYTKNDVWEWDRRFECPFDFSTIEWDSYTLTIGCVDNSLAAKIKSNKGTKYEFEVRGIDGIDPDRTWLFDRLYMEESLTYEITGGENSEDSTDLMVDFRHEKDANYVYPYMGTVGDEVSIKGVVFWNEDQDNTKEGYMFEALQDIENIVLKWRCEVFMWNEWFFKGGPVFVMLVRGSDGTLKEYPLESPYDMPFSLKEGDKVSIAVRAKDSLGTMDAGWNSEVGIKISSAKFVWAARGNTVEIPVMKPQTVGQRLLDAIAPDMDARVVISKYDSRIAGTYLMAAESIRALDEAKFYSSFTEFCDWMSAVFGYTYYIHDDGKTVEFLHRTELLSPDAPVRKIEYNGDVEYSVDSSFIYTALNIGYEKKDYENTNGRNEFNFNNTYSLGCDVTDKTLSLISKYRCDCYGIEFNVQKRGEDTSDTKSDSDVFFVLCRESGDRLVTDRSSRISVSNTFFVYSRLVIGSLFNIDFNPIECVYANRNYIAVQGMPMRLEFTSSEANISSNTVFETPRIGTGRIKSPINFNEALVPLATAGVLSFTTDDLEEPAPGDLIEITDMGVTYRGYLKDVDYKYAREEAAKYKLIVKDIVR